MPKKDPEEPKPLSFATPNPWSALPRQVYVGKGRGKKEGATTESPVDGQDQPKIYTIRDHTLEDLMHPDVLELHAVRVVHTPHGDMPRFCQERPHTSCDLAGVPEPLKAQ